MSNVNIERLVKNIKSNTTTIYTPIIEIIVNAIQAIEEKGNIEEGEIKVIVKRNVQAEFALDSSIAAIEGIVITDNGIGFTDENKESFDTLYGDHKIRQGGKGFGRFICLKYFQDLHVESVYFDSAEYKKINFSMGKRNNIIVDEKVANSSSIVSGTSIHLDCVRNNTLLNKKLSTISGILVEKLLPYFTTKDYTCPTITLVEENDSGKTILNDYINHNSSSIKEVTVEKDTFSLGNDQNTHEFKIRVFKIYSPKGQVSKVSLVADKRGVTDTSISSYIPEFVEEFYDKRENGSDIPERNYIIKVYVFSEFLDKNVSLERGGFEFQKENDLLYGISQVDIERKATELTKEAVVNDISLRQEKKEKRISSYVEEEAPWHKELLNKIDLSSFPYNSSNEDIEVRLQKEKFQKEVAIRNEINILLRNDNNAEFEETILEIVERISESSKNDLIHYIASRVTSQ
jgi:Histidine kinase-, DNA gyrase B-, and HSP90-like ATPase